MPTCNFKHMFRSMLADCLLQHTRHACDMKSNAALQPFVYHVAEVKQTLLGSKYLKGAVCICKQKT